MMPDNGSLGGEFSASLFDQISYLVTLDKSTTERAAALWKESSQTRGKWKYLQDIWDRKHCSDGKCSG